MKYTIEGFSQEIALSFKKEIKVKKDGKEYLQTLKLDVIDLMLLRWFVDFYPKMKKKIVGETQYAWINYQTMVDDLPLLSIEKKQVYRRFKKMCDLEILTHHHEKEGGSFSYYGFGEKYAMLIETPEPSQKDTPRTSESYPLGLQSPTKDSSTNNSSTNYSKVSKKVSKKSQEKNEEKTDNQTFDELIDEYTDNEYLRTELKEHLKTRKAKKGALTNHAIELSFKTLDKLTDNVDEKILIVQKSIENGWTSFFPLLRQQKQTDTPNTSSYDIEAYENYNILDKHLTSD